MKKIVLIAAFAASAVFAETPAVAEATVDAAKSEATQVVTEVATDAIATESNATETEAKEATPAM